MLEPVEIDALPGMEGYVVRKNTNNEYVIVLTTNDFGVTSSGDVFASLLEVELEAL